MDTDAIAELVARQRAHFASGATRDVDGRIESLRTLKRVIEEHEGELMEALHADLGKPEMESFMGELGVVLGDIDEAIDHARAWSRPHRVATSLAVFPGSSERMPQPLGVALIIAPWNYPFGLLMGPLVGALAAGCCAVLKPSELSASTSSLVARLVGDAFDERHVAVVEGAIPETTALLEQRFDHIFFTGGGTVGRIVMQAAARNLTPVALELGGKSPCIVDRTAPLDVTARRIAWGKFMNAGQTCIAPDYVLVEERVKDGLIAALRTAVHRFYGEEPHASKDYARIINDRHFERLTSLMDGGTPVIGGDSDKEDRYIAPTVLDDVKGDHPLMQDEIFGPLLPIIPVKDVDAAIAFVNDRPRPLALYIFSRDKCVQDRVLADTCSGGACVNDTLVHVGMADLPFGGVGESGMGAYHCKEGFDTFTHHRSVMRRSLHLDLDLRYPPYSKKLPWIKRTMRWLG